MLRQDSRRTPSRRSPRTCASSQSTPGQPAGGAGGPGRSRGVHDLVEHGARCPVQPQVVRGADHAEGVLWLAGSGRGASEGPGRPSSTSIPRPRCPRSCTTARSATCRGGRGPAVGAQARRRALRPGHPAAADGHQEGRVHGDQAGAHRPLETPGAGALYPLSRSAQGAEGAAVALGPNFTPALRQYVRGISRRRTCSNAPHATWSTCWGCGRAGRDSGGVRSSSCAGRAQCATIATG